MSDVNHENEIEELKRKLLTNELMTGILMVNIVRVLDKLAPAGNATESILSVLRQGQEKIPEIVPKMTITQLMLSPKLLSFWKRHQRNSDD